MSRLVECDVVSVRPIDGEGNTKAFVDIRIGGGLLIHGCSVMNGRNGLFVNMPRTAGRDGIWRDVVNPVDDNLRKLYRQRIMDAYEDKLQKQEDELVAAELQKGEVR